MSTSTKDGKDVSKKADREASRLLQNDQEKQRKEKIKTCIGEIAKELPPSSEHIDRKPSTLSIVSQAKEYIRKLKEQNSAYERNETTEPHQEELKRLRQAQADQIEKIRQLEETLKNYALEKVVKKNNDHNSEAVVSESESTRRRPKTINKLLEKQEQLQQQQQLSQEIHGVDGSSSLPALTSGGANSGGVGGLSGSFSQHHHTGGVSAGIVGTASNSTLPPSSLMPPSSSAASSSISIMTVAPTILSVKSPSIGQARGNHHHRHQPNGPSGRTTNNSINSSSAAVTTVVGSTAGSRINSSVSSVVSYLDVIGADFVNSLGGGDGGNLNLPAATASSSSVLSSSASQLTCSSSSVSSSLSAAMPARSSLDLHQQVQSSVSGIANCSNTSAMVGGGMQGTQELPLLQNHQGGLAANHSLLNFNSNANSQATEICVNNASALQTLASVATSTHMVGGMQPPSSSSSGCGNTPSQNMVASGMGLGPSPAVSLGQLQQQHQQPIMALSNTDAAPGLHPTCKQVIINGQVVTFTDQDPECQGANVMAGQQTLTLGSNPLQPNGPLHTQQHNQSNINLGSAIPGAPFSSNQQSTNSTIYTLNEHGQLVPLQPQGSQPNQLSALDLGAGNGGSNLLANLGAPPNLLPASLGGHVAQPGPNFSPIVSQCGPGGQAFTLLPGPQGTTLQTQLLPNGQILLGQQQQQVLSLGGLGGLQVINPLQGMVLNGMAGPSPANILAGGTGNPSLTVPGAGTATLNGATVKLIGNELKLVGPGDIPVSAQTGGGGGPTHVMVDGSLIPISTNPQTIVPPGSALPLSTVVGTSKPPQQLSLGGSSMLQFDPSNPGGAPILINTPGQPGALQLGPPHAQLQLGMPGAAHVPTSLSSSGGLGIFQQLSSSSVPPSLQQQLGAAIGGSVVVASTMVTSTVTTNALSSCISSPSVTASASASVGASKLIKGLPHIAPALNQTSQAHQGLISTSGVASMSSPGSFPNILPSALPQQFIINGHKVIAPPPKLIPPPTSSAMSSTKTAKNRKSSPSVSRASPVVTAQVAPQIVQRGLSPAATALTTVLPALSPGRADKGSTKSKSKKQQSLQKKATFERKLSTSSEGSIHKADLLAQATATAGISMEGETVGNVITEFSASLAVSTMGTIINTDGSSGVPASTITAMASSSLPCVTAGNLGVLSVSPAVVSSSSSSSSSGLNSSSMSHALNISSGSSGSSDHQLQIHIKSSPLNGLEEDDADNVQLIIDENCGGLSSVSPGATSVPPHSSTFSPPFALSIGAATFSTSDIVGTTGISSSQSLLLQTAAAGGDLSTPLVSPSFTIRSTTGNLARHTLSTSVVAAKFTSSSAITTNSMSSLSSSATSLSPALLSLPVTLGSTVTPVTASALNSSQTTIKTSVSSAIVSKNNLQPDDLFAHISSAIVQDYSSKAHTSTPSQFGAIGNVGMKLQSSTASTLSSTGINISLTSPMTALSVSTTISPTVAPIYTDISPPSSGSSISAYVPIAPAPTKSQGLLPSALNFGSDFGFGEQVIQALIGPEKPEAAVAPSLPTSKGRSRSKKASTLAATVLVDQSVIPNTPEKTDTVTVSSSKTDKLSTQESENVSAGKKRSGSKKKKSKAELQLEKEQRDKSQKEGILEKSDGNQKGVDKPKLNSSGGEENLMPVLEVSTDEEVKERILHSVSESKLLGSDGSQISLMDMVDKLEIFTSSANSPLLAASSVSSISVNTGCVDYAMAKSSMVPLIVTSSDANLKARCLSLKSSSPFSLPTQVVQPKAAVADDTKCAEKPEKSASRRASLPPKRESARRRRVDQLTKEPSPPRLDCKRSRKGSAASTMPFITTTAVNTTLTTRAKVTESASSAGDTGLFGSLSSLTGASTSDIYDFVDDEPGGLNFSQAPPTPAAKSPAKKTINTRKGRSSKNPTVATAVTASVSLAHSEPAVAASGAVSDTKAITSANSAGKSAAAAIVTNTIMTRSETKNANQKNSSKRNNKSKADQVSDNTKAPVSPVSVAIPPSTLSLATMVSPISLGSPPSAAALSSPTLSTPISASLATLSSFSTVPKSPPLFASTPTKPAPSATGKASSLSSSSTSSSLLLDSAANANSQNTITTSTLSNCAVTSSNSDLKKDSLSISSASVASVTSSAITPTTTNSLASTLEESFSMPMDFQQVMDFHNPPKLTGDNDAHEDPDNSMGLPGGDTLADFFSQNSPGKIMLAPSPPTLHNGVLSPSVELPALRTPAPPPMHHNHQEDHGLMLVDTEDRGNSGRNSSGSKNFVSPSNQPSKVGTSSSSSMTPGGKQQSMSRMHTPPPPERKSPGNTLAEISLRASTHSPSTQPPTPSLSLPPSTSPPPLSSSLAQSVSNGSRASASGNTSNLNSATSSCMKSSSAHNLHHHHHHHHHHEASATTASDPNPSALEDDDAPMPSLSTSSLDALSDILPLKPITSEIEESCAAVAAVEAAAAAAATSSSNQGPIGGHSTQPLSHVPLPTSELTNIGQMQQQRQPTPQHQHMEIQQQPQHHHQQQQQQQQHMDMQQRQNPLLAPQSSPHTLHPPSASTTPLPSPKHHASPGSASNAGSVHSMSPAAQQQQQQHHSCHKQQQQQQQMGGNTTNNSMMTSSGGVPALSHPPQHPSPSMNQMFPPLDSSPRNANFASPPSGSSMKLKHMSPSSSSVHTTPEHQQQTQQQQPNNQASYMNNQKQQQQQGAFSQGTSTNQALKKHYSTGDKMPDAHPNASPVAAASSASRMGSDNFAAFNNINSGANAASPGHSTANIPSMSSNNPSGFSFSLSSNGSANQQQQQSSCSANMNKNNGSGNSTAGSTNHRGAMPTLPQAASAIGTNLPLSSHPTHTSPYRSPFFPTPHPSMNLAVPSHSASTSTPSVLSHQGLNLHPLGNMEIQHPFSQTMDSSGGPPYGMIGAPSLMAFSNPPKLDIPPIAKSPTYNNSNASGNSGGGNSNANSASSNNTSNKSPGSNSNNYSGGANSSKEHGHSSASSSSSSSNRGYQGSSKATATAESIYQQQQKRPNTIQHPPAGLAAHMDPMARLGSLQSNGANNNSSTSFFGMGFPAPAPSPAPSSLASASMPLRHLPDTNPSSASTSGRYDYPAHLLPPSSHHVPSAMSFPPPHSQLPAAYGAHSSFTRDCARLDSSHIHQQPQQQQQVSQQQQQQSQQEASPRKPTSSKKSGSGSSSSSGHRGSNSSSSNSNSSTANHSHSPATSSSSSSSSRGHASNHHSSNTSNSGTSSSSHNNRNNNSSSSTNSSSSSSSQKRKTSSSSSSSSKKKSTGSQHSGYPSMDPMDTAMGGASMFEPSLSYFNFPPFSQSMSPPAARPHHQNEAATNMPPPPSFLGGMFNPSASARPISNSAATAGSKAAADMSAAAAASHFPLFHTRSPHSNSFFQAGGFGMNSMTGQHPGQAPHHHHHPHHSMGMPPHMTAAAAFGLFGGGGNDAASACAGGDNINIPQANKFLHQGMDHSGLQHGAHQTTASLYHSRPHSAQPHMMAAFYPHSFDSRTHMQQAFNSSMGPPPHFHAGLPPINFPMHDTH